MKKQSLGILTTVSFSIKMFYPGQLEALNRAGLRTSVICADDPDLPPLLPPQTRFIPVDFSRLWSPLQDLKTLWQLYKVFRREKFALVQYSTPKASLLGALAAWAARIPFRIYILWGLYYTGQSGMIRSLLKSFEKIICTLSTHIVPIAHQMVDFVNTERLAPPEKCTVMLHGSACGVDLQKFQPLTWIQEGKEIRRNFNIPDDAVVVGTVARLTNAKGVNELDSCLIPNASSAVTPASRPPGISKIPYPIMPPWISSACPPIAKALAKSTSKRRPCSCPSSPPTPSGHASPWTMAPPASSSSLRAPKT